MPDIAVRQHLDQFYPLLDLMRNGNYPVGQITEIAVTCGPGLIGCLGVGLSIGKTLAELWRVPVVGVNHLRGHAFSPFMKFASNVLPWDTLLPHLGLLVSGGNTLLFELGTDRVFKIIARTMDDAAGEALDKGAKLLGIPYPGGAELESRARRGNSDAFTFPRAFQSKNEPDFSFSGLKTSLLYQLQKMSSKDIEFHHADLCASYQEAAVDQIVKKCSLFFDKKAYKSFGLSGGVANNQALRDRFEKTCHEKKLQFQPAKKKYTGDNAAMIAFVAHQDRQGLWSNRNGELNFNPSLALDEVPPSN